MHQENTKLFSIKVPNHRWNRWKNALFTVNYVNNRFFFFLLKTKIFQNSPDGQKNLFGQNKKIHDIE
jgi:hypothetical protein